MLNLGDLQKFYVVLIFMPISLPLLLVAAIVLVKVTTIVWFITSDLERAREVSQKVE